MAFDSAAILDFWFADSAVNHDSYVARNEVWFRYNEQFDEDLRTRFGAKMDDFASIARQGLSESLEQNLAMIIAMDQFPRNIFRGTAKAFAFDSIALSLTQDLIADGRHEDYAFVERVFVYLPLEHTEDLEVQRLSVEMYQLLAKTADSAYQVGARMAVDYAKLHLEIIEKFGRFPHRNDLLGRESTPQEKAYLASGSETFGQIKK